MLGLGIVVLAGSIAGCRSKAKTPADGYKRLSEAVNAGDGGALFDALDQQTRWNWMSIQKFHREAYDIVLSNYPEGEVRERETRRFERAATAPSARDLFISDAAPTILPMLRPSPSCAGGSTGCRWRSRSLPHAAECSHRVRCWSGSARRWTSVPVRPTSPLGSAPSATPSRGASSSTACC